MDKISPFDHAAREFLNWARIETGLSASTLEAYGRDLRYMKEYLVGAGVKSPDSVRMEHLAQHLQQLKATSAPAAVDTSNGTNAAAQAAAAATYRIAAEMQLIGGFSPSCSLDTGLIT